MELCILLNLFINNNKKFESSIWLDSVFYYFGFEYKECLSGSNVITKTLMVELMLECFRQNTLKRLCMYLCRNFLKKIFFCSCWSWNINRISSSNMACNYRYYYYYHYYHTVCTTTWSTNAQASWFNMHEFLFLQSIFKEYHSIYKQRRHRR